MSGAFPGCQGLETMIEVTMDGALTFMADGNYVDVQAREVRFQLIVPLGCLPSGATCATIAGVDGTQTETHCIINQHEEGMETDLGAYTVSGSTATMTESDGDVDIGNFCIQGEQLTVEVIDAVAGIRAILTQHRAH
jgi:hypothetical protein